MNKIKVLKLEKMRRNKCYICNKYSKNLVFIRKNKEIKYKLCYKCNDMNVYDKFLKGVFV